MHEGVGLQDMSRLRQGDGHRAPAPRPGSTRLLANRIPKKTGRIGLCHLLSENGGVRSEFTVLREAADRFYLVSAGAAERHDHDYLSEAAAHGRQRATSSR